jgi:hypothetical protein
MYKCFFSKKRLVARQQITHGYTEGPEGHGKKDVSRKISIIFSNKIFVDARRPTFFYRQTKNN